jgi:phage-related protein
MIEILRNKLEVVFYRSGTGNEPVRDWLKKLSKEDKKILGEDIKTVQFGWPLGMPLVRSMSNGLWEVRSSLMSKRIARVIFFMDKNIMVLLHGFIKKRQKTSNDDINLALQRKKEFVKGGRHE